MSVKNKLREKHNSKNVLMFEWVLAILVGLMVFSLTAYSDMRSLTIWSTNVWDVTLDSNIRHLYEYSAKNLHGVHHYMGSELMSVLPWSIWNLPIWAIQRFCGIDINTSAPMLAWSKLFLVLLTAFMLKYTYLIAMQLTGDKSKSVFAAFLSGSSVYTYISVCYAGQNDILMILPSVIAVYYLIRGNRKAFYIISAVAIAIKPFYLVAYVAVILLMEKNILKAVLKSLFGVVGIVAQKILFFGAPMYSESIMNGPSSNMLEAMFPKNLNTSFGPVSFFAIALVGIYFYCFTRKFNGDNLLFSKYVVYVISVTYMAYIMFSPFSYYRIFIIVPFVYLMIIQNEQIFEYNIIFDSTMSLTLLLKILLRGGSRAFLISVINDSLVGKMLGYNVNGKLAYHPGVAELVNSKFPAVDSLQPLFSGIAIASCLFLILLNHPNKKVDIPVNGTKCPRWLIWLRSIIIVPFLILLLILFIKCEYRIY